MLIFTHHQKRVVAERKFCAFRGLYSPPDVAQALLPAGADILVGAGERSSPGQAKACPT
jgi:hypothetical protein